MLQNRDNEIRRLKSLCWFYMALAGGLAITTAVFCWGWLDMVSWVNSNII